jgi:hypothetical protein
MMLTIFTLYKNSDENSLFKLNKNISTIVLGHSHPECAFNDSLIDNFKNLGNSAEPYFYTYFKIKEILKYNPQIKNVLVEYSNNSLDKNTNDWVWGENYLFNSFPKYIAYMDFSDLELLFSHNFRSFIDVLSITFKRNLFNFFSKGKEINAESYGGYLYLKRFKTDSLINAMTNEKNTNESKIAISTVNLNYLKKIVSLCNSGKVHIFFVRSPLNSSYPELRNEGKYKEILKNEFSNIDFLDFKDYPLTNDEFGDLEHLNYKGAKVFSLYFNKLLKEGLLTKKNKQTVIDNSMSLR